MSEGVKELWKISVTRQEAIALGLSRYNGKPCKFGHVEKWVGNRYCCECNRLRERDRDYYAAHREERCAYQRSYHAKNKDFINAERRQMSILYRAAGLHLVKRNGKRTWVLTEELLYTGRRQKKLVSSL